MKKSAIYICCLFILFLFFTGLSLARADVDNRIYATLLKKHVTNEHVNYDGFQKDEKLLDDYLAILGHVNVNSLSKKGQFAFYINVYNAFTIKLILTKYPGINSIKEIGSFFTNPWNIKFISLQGKTVTLDHIEHKILRPRFKDPRVHFAINCASKSCPPLLDEPYDEKNLENQLNNQTRKFINDKRNTFLKKNTLFISKIFKWFQKDFADKPILFIRQHASDELKEKLDSSEGDVKISYLNYDWTLNR